MSDQPALSNTELARVLASDDDAALENALIRRMREEAVRQTENAQLERRIALRSQELAESNIRLLHEITERRETESELRQLHNFHQALLQSAGEGIIGLDLEGCCTFINRAALTMLNTHEAMMVGTSLEDLFHCETTGAEWPVWQSLRRGNSVKVDDQICVRTDGLEFAIEYSAHPVIEADGIIGAVIIFRDVTEARALADQLSFQATHDALTNLVNRREFERRLARVLNEAKVDQSQHALLYLDLDQFKIVNDSCGHSAGDELLRQIAARLQHKLRAGDMLARLGGDEFGVLLEHCPLNKAATIAEILRRSIEEFRFHWENQVFAIGVSIGLVTIDANSISLADITSAADAACYAAKDAGRNRIHVYEIDDENLSRRRGEMQWATRVKDALDHDLLTLYYQPIIRVPRPSDPCCHYEILIRMLATDGKAIAPGAFLPAAERYDLMAQIDRWVIDHVLSWLTQNPYHLSKLQHCAINLSAQSITDSKFRNYVMTQITSSNIPTDKICFEITETSAVADLRQASRFIGDLQAIGCKFSLDDFGTGMSSFSYLKNLPVDYVKIDGSFVRDITDDEITFHMVKSINDLVHVMGKSTIAEFVESNAILEKLKDLGVDYAQGYGVAKPKPLAMLAD